MSSDDDLAPMAGCLAIAAEAVSAMMAATRRTKGGLRHAQGLGTPKLIQPPESHVAGRGVGAAVRAYSGWRRFRPQRYTRISGDESARTGAGDRRRRHRYLGVADDPALSGGEIRARSVLVGRSGRTVARRALDGLVAGEFAAGFSDGRVLGFLPDPGDAAEYVRGERQDQ